jgi:predicted enzyme related to lactoylglutathione lyase
MSGRVVHFEIPYDDGDRARSFYKEAFGWQVQHMPDMDYTLVTTGPGGEQGPSETGFINGGLMSRGESLAGATVVVVDVTDIDAALEKIGSLGGSTVQGKLPVGEMGFSAYAKDSEGNVIGLWETAAGG